MSYALNRLGSAHIAHTPLFVSVEPANICQLRCPECPVGLKSYNPKDGLTAQRSYSATVLQRSGLMPLAVFRRILAECGETAWVMQFYFQGEPLLNKDLPQMIREAHEAGLYTIVSTNAQAMTQTMAQDLVNAGLDRIIISMDGLTQASYSAYRIGGDIEKAKAALRYLREAKGKTAIELQCLRLRANEHEWAALKKQYKALGADRLVFKTAQLYDYADGHPLMPTKPKYSRYIKGADGKYHRRRLGKGCFRVWSGCVVTTNGDVLPCCYDKAHAHAYGNIMSAHMSELFANEKAMTFRKSAMQEQPQICKECWK